RSGPSPTSRKCDVGQRAATRAATSRNSRGFLSVLKRPTKLTRYAVGGTPSSARVAAISAGDHAVAGTATPLGITRGRTPSRATDSAMFVDTAITAPAW